LDKFLQQLQWFLDLAAHLPHHESMAQPDTPNFSTGGRIVFGLIAIVVIVSLLRFLGVF
jgi:hypothetical protein